MPGRGQALRNEICGREPRVCGQCHGMLLAQIDMIRTLEAISAVLLGLRSRRQADAGGHAGRKVSCPACSRDMARDDYCGAGLAHFDRCEPCRLLWLGADALGTMTMMWARMERRLERTHKATEELLAEADNFVGSVLLGRATVAPLMRVLRASAPTGSAGRRPGRRSERTSACR